MTNIVPIVEPDRRWNIWSIDEIYKPNDATSEGRYIPNPDDLVFSHQDGFFIVDTVDYTTGESTLIPYRFPRHTGIDSGEELISIAPRLVSEGYNAYVDTSVVPHRLAIDKQLQINGSTTKTMRAYRGTKIETEELVSRYYINGVLQGDHIPLEKVVDVNGTTQDAIKIPKIGHVSKPLSDGELITLVFYDDQGHVVSLSTLTVVQTSWIRRAHEGMKTISSIELDSMFMSETEPNVLEVPINVNMESVPLHGIVHYTNGESNRLPVDGTKFKIMGMRHFISTLLGQRQPITLIYYLGNDEESQEGVDYQGGHIAESYQIVTTPVSGTYAVKLFTHPEWVSNAQGYRLKHHLHNLDRDEYYDVTNLVQVATNSPPFKPLDYGVQQEISFELNLQEADASFNNYNHLQTTNIVLQKSATQVSSPYWEILYDKNKPAYSGLAQVDFIGAGDYRVYIDNGQANQADWIDVIYRRLLPLHHPSSETQAPTPTHFIMQIDTWEQEYLIDMWNAEIQVSMPRTQGKLIFLHFIRRTAQKDLKLATAGLMVERIDT